MKKRLAEGFCKCGGDARHLQLCFGFLTCTYMFLDVRPLLPWSHFLGITRSCEAFHQLLCGFTEGWAVEVGLVGILSDTRWWGRKLLGSCWGLLLGVLDGCNGLFVAFPAHLWSPNRHTITQRPVNTLAIQELHFTQDTTWVCDITA